MNISFQTPLGGILFALFAYGLAIVISLFVALIIYLIYRTMRTSGKQGNSSKRAGQN